MKEIVRIEDLEVDGIVKQKILKY